jgi:hypothetical protein
MFSTADPKPFKIDLQDILHMEDDVRFDYGLEPKLLDLHAIGSGRPAAVM